MYLYAGYLYIFLKDVVGHMLLVFEPTQASDRFKSFYLLIVLARLDEVFTFLHTHKRH
jgi:hypothetical protein